jgi:hypothetical protein
MNCHCNATFLIDNYLLQSTSLEDIYFLANDYLIQPIFLESASYLTNDYLPQLVYHVFRGHLLSCQ